MTPAVPARLQVLNAFISLCRPYRGWASTLHDVGYRLAGIEIPCARRVRWCDDRRGRGAWRA
jgi:hypothetical protein